MYIRMRPLCWAVTLFLSACAVPGIAPAPEVEVSSEELYRPCVDQACGTECRQCAPNEPRCLETAVVKYCQADGHCAPTPPLCEAPNPCAFTLCPVGTRCEPNPKQPEEALCLPIDRCALVRCRAGSHCEDGKCLPDKPKVFCGGFGGFACPGSGKCIDDPDDNCSPPQGADCAGMCICKPIALCKPGTHWESSPKVCACVPDSKEKVFCGGIAGIRCPGAGECIDDPSDDCSPPQGADCGGLCICRQLSLCPQGSHWSADPKVCACVY